MAFRTHGSDPLSLSASPIVGLLIAEPCRRFRFQVPLRHLHLQHHPFLRHRQLPLPQICDLLSGPGGPAIRDLTLGHPESSGVPFPDLEHPGNADQRVDDPAGQRPPDAGGGQEDGEGVLPLFQSRGEVFRGLRLEQTSSNPITLSCHCLIDD